MSADESASENPGMRDKRPADSGGGLASHRALSSLGHPNTTSKIVSPDSRNFGSSHSAVMGLICLCVGEPVDNSSIEPGIAKISALPASSALPCNLRKVRSVAGDSLLRSGEIVAE